jgi:hypothetical protein
VCCDNSIRRNIRRKTLSCLPPSFAVHAMTFGVCAAEDRQREIEARAEKHVEHTRKLSEAITKSDKPKLH